MFYGIGGAGKIWLLKKLRSETLEDVPSAVRASSALRRECLILAKLQGKRATTYADTTGVIPYKVVGVVSGGAGPCTYDGTATAPFNSHDQKDYITAWTGQLSVQAAGTYNLKIVHMGPVVIGVAGGCITNSALNYNPTRFPPSHCASFQAARIAAIAQAVL